MGLDPTRGWKFANHPCFAINCGSIGIERVLSGDHALKSHRFLRDWVPLLLFTCGVFGGVLQTSAAEPDGKIPSKSTPIGDEAATSKKITAAIDRHIAQKWADEKISPAAQVDDALFARRVYLDLFGRIPRVGELREFLEDEGSDKREVLVAHLLRSAGFSTHFAKVLRLAWMPEGNSQEGQAIAPEFDVWLHKQISMNRGYDDIVRDILTVPLKPQGQGAYAFYNSGREPRPTAFYALRDIKPENLAAATARSFLGIRVECAQCHDHPVADWSQEDFWQFAAFFGGIRRDSGNPFGAIAELFRTDNADWDIVIPDNKKTVQAAFLDGTKPTKGAKFPRTAVADWLLGPSKRQFAKATVNRLWAHQLGLGLVDPVDDMESYNAPSHPELLEELATLFMESKYDVRAMLRGISMSRVYGLTSETTRSDTVRADFYRRRLPKAMGIDELTNSLTVAKGEGFQPRNQGIYYGGSPLRRVFEDGGISPVKRPTTVLQALTMMNGQPASQLRTAPLWNLLISASDQGQFNDFDRDEWIDTVFLAVVSRFPLDAERERVRKHLDLDDKSLAGEPKNWNELTYELLWALMNTSEFRTNH